MNLLAWLVIAVMVFFIFFGGSFTSREPPEDLKANMHRRNLDDDNNDNNDNDDGIHWVKKYERLDRYDYRLKCNQTQMK